MANERYAEFISEAFVKPIRSVLIVDDDYPTLEEMLDEEIRHEGQGRPPRSTKRWYDSPQRIKNVIDSFRSPQRPLLVDIHDGTNVDASGDARVASHLHQSDLLVLDYELDKARPRDGGRAIEILRSLMANDHFNLVVVHTSEDLDFVHREIIVGLLAPSGDLLSDEDAGRARDLIAEREDVDEAFPAALAGSVGNDQYLHSRLHPDTFLRTMGQSQQPYSGFGLLADAASWSNDDRRVVLRRSLRAVETPLQARMAAVGTPAIKWSQSAKRWIKSDSVFIAFASKDHDDVLRDLHDALIAWNPAPSRLFLAKLRAEMDEYGVVAQTDALARRHALAHWYTRLLKASGEERRWLIAESVSRHSDQLLHIILPRVEQFATRLVEAEAAAGNVEERVQHHFSIDLSRPEPKRRAEREHNAFVCSMPPQGWHLNTGHVFSVGEECWVCLTPACDLVPTQGDARAAAYGNRTPFMAVKLHSVEDGKPIDVNSNLFVFLATTEGVKTFCFNEQHKEANAPTWRTFYAEKRGVFGADFSFKVSSTQPGTRKLLYVVQCATVIAQLRYEYALNLLQRLGTSMTRIGLDFVG